MRGGGATKFTNNLFALSPTVSFPTGPNPHTESTLKSSTQKNMSQKDEVEQELLEYYKSFLIPIYNCNPLGSFGLSSNIQS